MRLELPVKILIFGLTASALLFVWTVVEEPPYEIVVTMFDVGQGDAILIQAPNGRTALIDAGPSKQVVSSIARELGRLRRTLDLILLTHPDADHIGGTGEILKHLSVAGILESGAKRKAKFFETLEEEIAKQETSRLLARPGITIDIDRGVRFEVLAPAADVVGKIVEKSNNLSVVARLRVGARSFLFMADAEKEEEAEVLARLARPRVDVLKVGHHGSRTSSSQSFLQNIRPKIALISVGRNNPYGHPHPEVLKRLRDLGSTIYQTDERGNIQVRTTGYTLTVD